MKLSAIAAPKQSWATPLEALEDALALEKDVNAKLLALHAIADEAKDPQMCDWIEGEFLGEQVPQTFCAPFTLLQRMCCAVYWKLCGKEEAAKIASA